MREADQGVRGNPRESGKEPVVRWHQSAIKCYLNCPQQYKLKYIDKREQEASPALEEGHAFHAVFDQDNKTFLSSGKFLPEEEMVYRLDRELDRRLSANTEILAKDHRSPGTIMSEALTSMRDYVQWRNKQRDKNLFAPIYSEYTFPPFEIVPGVWMEGTIDVISQCSARPKILMDYKRTRKPITREALLWDIQTSVYLLAMETHGIHTTGKVGHITLSKETSSVSYTEVTKGPEHFAYAKKLIAETVKAIEDRVFPLCLVSNHLCSPLYCGVAHVCRFPNGNKHV